MARKKFPAIILAIGHLKHLSPSIHPQLLHNPRPVVSVYLQPAVLDGQHCLVVQSRAEQQLSRRCAMANVTIACLKQRTQGKLSNCANLDLLSKQISPVVTFVLRLIRHKKAPLCPRSLHCHNSSNISIFVRVVQLLLNNLGALRSKVRFLHLLEPLPQIPGPQLHRYL